MPKKYADRSMAAVSEREAAVEEQDYFFPKATPPVSIRAKSREQAEEILAASLQDND
jgi:hypothetical protein